MIVILSVINPLKCYKNNYIIDKNKNSHGDIKFFETNSYNPSSSENRKYSLKSNSNLYNNHIIKDGTSLKLGGREHAQKLSYNSKDQHLNSISAGADGDTIYNPNPTLTQKRQINEESSRQKRVVDETFLDDEDIMENDFGSGDLHFIGRSESDDTFSGEPIEEDNESIDELLLKVQLNNTKEFVDKNKDSYLRYPKDNVPANQDQVFTFKGNEYVHVKSLPGFSFKNEVIYIAFDMQTNQANAFVGLLQMFPEGGDMPSITLHLHITNGFLEISLAHNLLRESFFHRGRGGIQEQTWISYEITINTELGTLEIRENEHLSKYSIFPVNFPIDWKNPNTHLFIGDVPDKFYDAYLNLKSYPSFKGCIRKFSIASGLKEDLSYVKPFIVNDLNATMSDHCLNACEPKNECKSGSNCINNYDSYSCDCFNTSRTGKHCEKSDIPILTLKADGHISHKIYPWSDQIQQYNYRISFKFKTVYSNSNLVYFPNEYLMTLNSKGNLEMLSGCRSFACKTLHVPSQILNSEVIYTDGKWHHVIIRRNHTRLYVNIDDVEIGPIGTMDPLKPISKSTIDQRITFGNIERPSNHLLSWHRFIGCMSEIFYNHEDILQNLLNIDGSAHTTNSRYIGTLNKPVIENSCQNINDISLSFTSESASTYFPISKHDIELEFKLKQAYGVIFSGNLEMEDAVEAWEIRILSSGIAFLIQNNIFNLTLEEPVQIQQFYKLGFQVNENLVQISLGNNTATKEFPMDVTFKPFITIGDGSFPYEQAFKGFVGCIRNLKFASTDFDLREFLNAIPVVRNVNSIGTIQFDQCKAETACSKTSDGICCEASLKKDKYKNNICESDYFLSSCMEYYLAGYRVSGNYNIKFGPKKSQAVVWCDFNTKNNEVDTVIYHNIPYNQAIRGNSLEHHILNITYRDFSDEMLRSLILESEVCSQSMEFKCQNAKLGLSKYTRFSTPWISNISQHGAEDFTCACHRSNSCDSPDVECNCDIMDNKKHSDSVVIFDKELLPVKSIAISQQEVSADGKATLHLGYLKCSDPVPLLETMAMISTKSSVPLKKWSGNFLSFSFRTDRENGLILSQVIQQDRILFQLYLNTGNELIFEYVDERVSKILQRMLIKVNYKLNDGQWHDVSLEIRSNFLHFNVDHQTRKAEVHVDFLNINNAILFFGLNSLSSSTNSSLVGCFKNLIIDYKLIPLKKYIRGFQTHDVLEKCYPQCDPNPCQRGSKCEQNWADTYKCICQNRFTQSGRHCEVDLNDDATHFSGIDSEIYNKNTTITNHKYNPLTNSFKFNFKTSSPRALLFMATDNVQNIVQVYLNGSAKFYVLFNVGYDLLRIEIDTGDTKLDNGEPVEFVFNRKPDSTEVILSTGEKDWTETVAKGVTLINEEDYLQFPFFNSTEASEDLVQYQKAFRIPSVFLLVFLGEARSHGFNSTFPPFEGCINGFLISDELISLNNDNIWERGSGNSKGCSSPCSNSNQCLNGGVCSQLFTDQSLDQFKCNCDGTSYIGEKCEIDNGYTFGGSDFITYEKTYHLENFTLEFSISTSDDEYSKEDQLLIKLMKQSQFREYMAVVLTDKPGNLMIWNTVDALGEPYMVDYPGYDLFDGFRHYITVTNRGNKINLTVDGHPYSVSVVEGNYEIIISENEYFYVGGSDGFQDFTFNSYTGCLSNLLIKSDDGKINVDFFDIYKNARNKGFVTKGRPKPSQCAKFRQFTNTKIIPKDVNVFGNEWIIPPIKTSKLEWSSPITTASINPLNNPEEEEEESNLAWLWILLGCLLLLFIILGIVYFIRYKKRKEENELHAVRSFISAKYSNASNTSEFIHRNSIVLQNFEDERQSFLGGKSGCEDDSGSQNEVEEISNQSRTAEVIEFQAKQLNSYPPEDKVNSSNENENGKDGQDEVSIVVNETEPNGNEKLNADPTSFPKSRSVEKLDQPNRKDPMFNPQVKCVSNENMLQTFEEKPKLPPKMGSKSKLLMSTDDVKPELPKKTRSKTSLLNLGGVNLNNPSNKSECDLNTASKDDENTPRMIKMDYSKSPTAFKECGYNPTVKTTDELENSDTNNTEKINNPVNLESNPHSTSIVKDVENETNVGERPGVEKEEEVIHNMNPLLKPVRAIVKDNYQEKLETKNEENNTSSVEPGNSLPVVVGGIAKSKHDSIFETAL